MRDIIGFEGLYTFDGENVRSVARQGTSGKVLKWNYNDRGRPFVRLCKDGKHTNFFKHQLIWMDAHQQAISSSHEIHHIDGDFSNNSIDNLQLLTKEEHQRLHGFSERTVNCFKDGKLISTYHSTAEAARQLELNVRHISECCNLKRKREKGYTFSYA